MTGMFAVLRDPYLAVVLVERMVLEIPLEEVNFTTVTGTVVLMVAMESMKTVAVLVFVLPFSRYISI